MLIYSKRLGYNTGFAAIKKRLETWVSEIVHTILESLRLRLYLVWNVELRKLKHALRIPVTDLRPVVAFLFHSSSELLRCWNQLGQPCRRGNAGWRRDGFNRLLGSERSHCSDVQMVT